MSKSLFYTSTMCWVVQQINVPKMRWMHPKST